jgi:hypothetical protein
VLIHSEIIRQLSGDSQVDAANGRLSRYKEARQCCTRCAVWRYWRGSEPSPPHLSFLGLWWVFAWGGAAEKLGIRRLLRALGVMFQRLIPRKSRALYDTPFVPRQNKDSLRLTCGASADWIRAGVRGISPPRTATPSRRSPPGAPATSRCSRASLTAIVAIRQAGESYAITPLVVSVTPAMAST